MHLKPSATTLGQTPGPNLQFQLVKIMHGIVCAVGTYPLRSFSYCHRLFKTNW
jgi:hypothetical protein